MRKRMLLDPIDSALWRRSATARGMQGYSGPEAAGGWMRNALPSPRNFFPAEDPSRPAEEGLTPCGDAADGSASVVRALPDHPIITESNG